MHALYLSNKNETWHIKRQHNDGLGISQRLILTSMCNTVNLCEKSLPKPTITYIEPIFLETKLTGATRQQG